MNGSVFTREHTDGLPAVDTYLRWLIVTPSIIVNQVNGMKLNKVPRVDGIHSMFSAKTVEQISIPLLIMFITQWRDCSRKLEEVNVIPSFEKCSGNKSENYRPVSLT